MLTQTGLLVDQKIVENMTNAAFCRIVSLGCCGNWSWRAVSCSGSAHAQISYILLLSGSVTNIFHPFSPNSGLLISWPQLARKLHRLRAPTTRLTGKSACYSVSLRGGVKVEQLFFLVSHKMLYCPFNWRGRARICEPQPFKSRYATGPFINETYGKRRRTSRYFLTRGRLSMSPSVEDTAPGAGGTSHGWSLRRRLSLRAVRRQLWPTNMLVSSQGLATFTCFRP